MDREAFFRQLNAALDAGNPPAEAQRLRADAAGEPESEALWRAQTALFAELGKRPTPPTDLADRILAASRTTSASTQGASTDNEPPAAPSRQGRWLALAAWATLAAGLLGAIVLVQAPWAVPVADGPPAVPPAMPEPGDLGEPGDPVKPSDLHVPADPSEPAQPPTRPDELPLDELIQRASRHSLALATDTRENLSELKLLWPEGGSGWLASTEASSSSWPGASLLEGFRERMTPAETSGPGVWDYLLPADDDSTENI